MMGLNNRVIMSDGSALPCAEGEGGAAKVIKNRLAGNKPSGPMATSALNIELVPEQDCYNEEPEELAVLGGMEFEVLPAERTDKSKRAKPYDRPDSKKVAEKTIPDNPTRLAVPPNRAYVELPPTILKCQTPVQPILPVNEDEEMDEVAEEVIPNMSKDKQRDRPVIVPTVKRTPDVTSQKPKVERRYPVMKEAPKFEVVNPRAPNDKQRNQGPQYKYATEIMNETNQESVFQKLLAQPVTMKLGEVLGSSYELGRQFQLVTRSQHFPVQQAKMSNIELLKEIVSRDSVDSDDEYEDDADDEKSEMCEFMVNSGEASPSRSSTEELHELDYQRRIQEEYEQQFTYPVREVNLARPHEYRAMVTARLSGKIGEIGYTMLVDSGSELNIMTLQQAQELALPIDDSGNSWTLKGISGHTMGLEGICWNVPVQIGGIEFSHNFFVTRSNLGNKDMVLGQPWLFSHST